MYASWSCVYWMLKSLCNKRKTVKSTFASNQTKLSYISLPQLESILQVDIKTQWHHILMHCMLVSYFCCLYLHAHWIIIHSSTFYHSVCLKLNTIIKRRHQEIIDFHAMKMLATGKQKYFQYTNQLRVCILTVFFRQLHSNVHQFSWMRLFLLFQVVDGKRKEHKAKWTVSQCTHYS